MFFACALRAIARLVTRSQTLGKQICTLHGRMVEYVEDSWRWYAQVDERPRALARTAAAGSDEGDADDADDALYDLYEPSRMRLSRAR